MARSRKSNSQDVDPPGVPPVDDLYDYARPPAVRSGRPAPEDPTPGVSATDDRRPEFQRMIDAATARPPAFDVILVHSFSRFFRHSSLSSTSAALPRTACGWGRSPWSSGTTP
jgi:hypothetical protein